MADVSRKKQVQTVFCPKCKHKTIKHIVIKGRGG